LIGILRSDTIAAISTPPGEGAIAVVRVSGPDALAIAGKILGRSTDGLAPRTLHFGAFRDGAERIDEGLMAVFRSPNSYTGEDAAEFHGHGGVLVAARLLEAVLKAGARAAGPGEFTQRAFLNGRMDLTQAEAVMDVIRASTPRALRAAEEQLAGRLGVEIEALRVALLGVIAHLEAWIDFPEEGIDPHAGAGLLEDLQSVESRILHLLSTANEGRILREGVRLVLCGAPNAGKSSLLNRLLGFERAIVSDVPGTTRDTIEEFASLGGIPFRITDTAGLRDSEDAVEREGVVRARRAMESADVTVRVVDGTDAGSGESHPGDLVVFNKSDLCKQSPSLPGLRISCLTGEGIPELVHDIVSRAVGAHPIDAPSLAAINARHQACLDRALGCLREAMTGIAEDLSPELTSPPLRAALDSIGEVTGATGIEDILGEIFSRFCIGK